MPAPSHGPSAAEHRTGGWHRGVGGDQYPGRVNSGRGRVVGHVIGGCVSGALVGMVGTVAHRAVVGEHYLPYGIVLALAAVLLGGTCMRAWSGYPAVAAYGVALAVAVGVLAYISPGGDVLVPAQVVGYVWIVGSLVLVAVVFFLPGSWFADVPLRGGASLGGRPSSRGPSSVESG